MHIKDPVVHVKSFVGYGNMQTLYTLTRGKNWVALYYVCSLSPQGKQPEFPMHCIGTRKVI